MLLKKRQRFDDVKLDGEADKTSVFVDLQAIVRVSQEITREHFLQNTIDNLMKLLLENTNAVKGYFLVESNNQLMIVSKATKKDTVESHEILENLDVFDDIAQSVVFYVIRTRKTIVLDDASKDAMFAYNTYIKTEQPHSILCVPVAHQEKLNGILYLENPDLKSAFAPKLVENLNLLLSLVSPDLENKMLHDAIDRMKEEHHVSQKKLEKRIQVLEQELESRIV